MTTGTGPAWWSRRAITLHVALLVVVATCVAAAWWQVRRAATGNLLSYGYAVEWPFLGLGACALWWDLVHETSGDRAARRRKAPIGVPPGPRKLSDAESPDLRSYNRALAVLAAGGKRKTWRNPRGLP